nr:16S rRNA (cytosine(967)-C(5))-methyltransferase RsmB [Eubacterium sp.]
MIKSSRLVAFETLYKIFYDSAYSNLALDSALKGVNEDKAFISALVYGVVERRLTLDFFIKKYLKSKPKPKILTILRMGAYQLLFMDKVPSNAAINESVELTKAIKQDYYSSLVNAVLHKIDNDRIIPDDDLSVKYSVPQNLINMWLKQYDKEAVESFLPNINERPPIFAVPNLLYVDADELLYELMSEGIEGEVVDELVMITSSFDLSNSKAFANGLFHIEDMSSYECAKALGAKPYEIVLDMCSAPGGKSFTIAEHMQNKGTLLAFDLHEHRVKQIEDGSDRLGISIIKATVNDASVYNPNLPKADRILCDVPCSGFGIIRRKPEIRYKELDSISDLPAIQLGILETSAKYLKDGGALIYSTCTLNKKENEKVVNAFLNNNSDFTLAGERTKFPSKLG